MILLKLTFRKRLETQHIWALRAFEEWRKSRNEDPDAAYKCPPDLLQTSCPDDILDYWLAAFILEVRKADGGLYTPESMNCMVAGIQQQLRHNLENEAPQTLSTKRVNDSL